MFVQVEGFPLIFPFSIKTVTAGNCYRNYTPDWGLFGKAPQSCQIRVADSEDCTVFLGRLHRGLAAQSFAEWSILQVIYLDWMRYDVEVLRKKSIPIYGCIPSLTSQDWILTHDWMYNRCRVRCKVYINQKILPFPRKLRNVGVKNFIKHFHRSFQWRWNWWCIKRANWNQSSFLISLIERMNNAL